MKLNFAAALLVLSLLTAAHIGCALNSMHPGRRLVARKCTACHDEPDRNALRGLDLVRLEQIHEGKQVLDSEQLARVQAYANETDSGDVSDDQSR